MVHNYYQQPGGEERSFFYEAEVLRQKGHEVITYTRHNDELIQLTRLSAANKALWNRETYHEILEIALTNKPDVVHFQNTFPLISPSVYYAIKSLQIPVVQSLRNFRLLCPGSFLYRSGQVCEQCLNKIIPWPGVFHRCYRHSYPATATVAAMLVLHRLLGTWSQKIDAYIALTEMVKEKFIQGGFPNAKIFVKPNFAAPPPQITTDDSPRKGALFVGRLSPEKGIKTLLEAWKSNITIPLTIVGDGPLASLVKQATDENQSITWLGQQPADKVFKLMAGTHVLIFPSEWYETFGRVAIEAFAQSTPVIASKIGAIEEIVSHGRTGLLFAPGNAQDLTEKVKLAYSNMVELRCMGKKAHDEYTAKYTPERNYEHLMDIYHGVLRKSGRNGMIVQQRL